MMTVTKAVSFLALLCPLGLASDCGASCAEEDHTSLLQVKEVVMHGSERAAPAGAEEELENKEDEKAETQDKEKIPVIAGGMFVAPPMVAAVGADLGREAAIGAAENRALLGRAAVERGEVAAMAARASLESEPMHPNMWPTPVVNWRAIEDSTPYGIDPGEVTSAFGNNMERAKATVVGRTAGKLAFEDKVHDERRAIKLATMAAIRRDKIAAMEAMHKDKVDVAATEANRLATIGEAVERVNLAKEEALAHSIKQKQAQKAALMGRLIGAKEGAEDAARADAEQKHKWAVERAASEKAAEKKAILSRKAAERAAVDKATAVRAAEMDVFAARDRKEALAFEASASADASLYEEDFNGPEDMKNTIELHEADRVAKGYARLAGENGMVAEDLAVGADRKAVADQVDVDESQWAAAAETGFP